MDSSAIGWRAVLQEAVLQPAGPKYLPTLKKKLKEACLHSSQSYLLKFLLGNRNKNHSNLRESLVCVGMQIHQKLLISKKYLKFLCLLKTNKQK